MKQSLTLALLFPMIIGCTNPDARAVYQNDCKRDATLEQCTPLHAVSTNSYALSQAIGATLAIALNRPMQILTVRHETSIPEPIDVVSDQVLGIRIKQPNKESVLISIPNSQIVLGSNLGQSFDKPNQIIVTVLPANLQNLVPGESTVVEVDLTGWQGDTYTDSLPITITP